MNKVIVVGGGSFQGKSIVALHIAYRYKIPSLICTDIARSILTVLSPTKSYLSTSTYLLSPEDLEKQMKAVSDVMQKLLPIYEKRGESIIIEGMHLTSDFIEYISKKSNAVIFCLNNRLPLEKRLEYKGMIRDRVEYRDPKTGEIVYTVLGKNKLYLTPYMQHSDRIEEIHKQILKYFSQRNLPIINFHDINIAINDANTIIEGKFRKV